jgi:hypothetical protein
VVVVGFIHFGFEVVEDAVALQLALQFFRENSEEGVVGDFVDEGFEVVVEGSDVDGSIVGQRGDVVVGEGSGGELVVLQALVAVSAQVPVAIFGDDEGHQCHSLDEVGIRVLLLYLNLDAL